MTISTRSADGRGLHIGILALQGDVREHRRVVEASGATAALVRRPADLEPVDGLIIPGGESTTIDKLSRIFRLAERLKDRSAGGLPVFGSCAGMILLASDVANPALDGASQHQQTFGGLDITVRRNVFGRQRESFETDLQFRHLAADGREAAPVHAVFIRAPWVERAGPGVEVLASVEADDDGHPDPAGGTARIVAVRSGRKLATSFHPEVTGERRIHELFIRMIRGDA